MLEQLKKRLEEARASVAANYQSVEKLMEDWRHKLKQAETDLVYLSGHRDALTIQLKALEQDAPPAATATEAALAAGTDAVAEKGANPAADIAAVEATVAAAQTDAQVASDVADLASKAADIAAAAPSAND